MRAKGRKSTAKHPQKYCTGIIFAAEVTQANEGIGRAAGGNERIDLEPAPSIGRL
jgi:hypothetical protein